MTASSSPRPETVERLLQIVAEEGMVDREKLQLDAPLDAVGLKSADVLMVLIAIEEQFGVYVSVDSELTDAKTVGDLVNAIALRIENEAKG